MAKKEKFRLVNYFDVWGNEEDGWEVNNLCTEGTYESEGNTDEAYLHMLIHEANFLLDTVTLDDIEFSQDSFEMIEFSRKDNGKPLGRLELVA